LRKHPVTEINRIVRENRISDYQSPNLALGMRPIEFGPGTSKWSWREPPAQVLNPFGGLQGGYLAVFMDELFSTAMASVLEDEEWAVTAEFKLSFLRALTPQRLAGNARVLRRSRAVAFLEAEITSEDGAAAVRASSTWAISRRQDN
jgi:uncharacterized protein (TIGR00369 family)